MNNNSNPIIFNRRKGTYDDPFVDISEIVTIVNGKAQLQEIPNEYNRVQVEGLETYWVEISQVDFDNNEVIDINGYLVDYIEGAIYFNSEHEGKTVSVSYLGEGYHLFPDSRIYLTKEGSFTTFADKLTDIDRMYNEEKSRVDTLIVENPQPSEVVDLRVSRTGIVHQTARAYITSLEQRIEELENTINEMVNNE